MDSRLEYVMPGCSPKGGRKLHSSAPAEGSPVTDKIPMSVFAGYPQDELFNLKPYRSNPTQQ